MGWNNIFMINPTPPPGIFLRSLVTLLTGILLWACANVMAPTGGPRDEDPPVVLRSTPPNYSPNYTGEQIRIYFDEFVTLANLRQQLLVSPPLENDPEFRIRGRSIIIDIEDELSENTTYNLFLGDAIRDITEGNAIPNFQFVFSTGDYVDSLSLGGQVIHAFTLEPVEGVSVMLYDNIYDSVPYKERPVYFARTNKEGLFTISNMREGEYLIFGLVDNNANFLYDLPDEKIAFLDSLVSPRYVSPPALPDTLAPDTLMVPDAGGGTEETGGTGETEERERGSEGETEGTGETGETGERERGREGETEGTGEREGDEVTGRQGDVGATLAVGLGDEPPVDPDGEPTDAQAEKTVMPFYTLYLFQEADTVQRVTSTTVIREGQIRFSFRVPFDSVCVRDLSRELGDDWHLSEFNEGRDSLTIWFTGLERDSLHLELFDGTHSLDTIKTATRPRATRRQATEEEELPPLVITSSARRGRAAPYFTPITLKTSAPIQDIDHSKISMLVQDSLPLDVVFDYEDHVRRTLVMEPLLEQGQAHKLDILPGAFTDMFGATNDTLVVTFNTTTYEDYGVLILNLTINTSAGSQAMTPDEGKSYILQLTNAAGSTLREKPISRSGTYRFDHLTPDNYSFRLIEDRNQNGKWDTGHYLRGIQPERVFLYDQTILIRQNWEDEMSWEIQIKPLTLHRE